MAMLIKILIVVTSNDIIKKTGKQTGWNLKEVAYPYQVFKGAGYDVDFVSPKGGRAPMNNCTTFGVAPFSCFEKKLKYLRQSEAMTAIFKFGSTIKDEESGKEIKDDKICQDFLKSNETMNKINNTMKPGDVKIGAYKVIMYAGGHGAMFDLPKNTKIASLARTVYQSGGIVSAVGHGPAGLIPIRLPNGGNIVRGKSVTSFTNAEEDAVELTATMPFLLESKLQRLGGIFIGKENFQANVQVSDRLITGQNPASATPMAKAIVKQLEEE